MNRASLIRRALLVLLLCAAATSVCGRGITAWPYDKLLAESDFVAIVEPLENKAASDKLLGYGDPEKFDAIDTRFKVHSILKNTLQPDPAGAPLKEITVLHFAYSKKVKVIINGAQFTRFIIGPVQYASQIVKDGKPGTGTGTRSEPPMWLLYLQRQADGRFIPVTGPYDSALSFKELHRPSLFANDSPFAD